MVGSDDDSTVVVVLIDDEDDAEVGSGRVVDVRPDLALVEALAWLQLAARRLGCSIRVHDPSGALCELLDLVGLSDVVVGAPDSGREVGRKTERGKQTRVEEVVQPDEPIA